MSDWPYPHCYICKKLISPDEGTSLLGPNNSLVYVHYNHPGVYEQKIRQLSSVEEDGDILPEEMISNITGITDDGLLLSLAAKLSSIMHQKREKYSFIPVDASSDIFEGNEEDVEKDCVD